jgi:hypothetical protein
VIPGCLHAPCLSASGVAAKLAFVRRRMPWPLLLSILLAGALACQGGNAKDPISDFPKAGGGDWGPLGDWPGQTPDAEESVEDDSPPQDEPSEAPQAPIEAPRADSAGSPFATTDGDSAADAAAVDATPSHPDAGEHAQENGGAHEADAGVATP